MLQNRYDPILLPDARDGNPNGGPDDGNLSRVDPEIGRGSATDVCIRRKVRNYTQMATDQDIFVRENPVLNDFINEAIEEATGKGAKTKNASDRDKARALMCQKYYDIRVFEVALSMGNDADQVRGSIQLTFARFTDPIFPHEHTIMRMAVIDVKEQKANEEADDKGGNRTTGRRAIVPYGLYKMYGFVMPYFAEDIGFMEDDLKLFREALQNVFDLDHSTACGFMSLQKLIIFKHESPLGNASAHKPFKRVTVARREGLTDPARGFSDYTVQIDRNGLQGVEVVELV